MVKKASYRAAADFWSYAVCVPQIIDDTNAVWELTLRASPRAPRVVKEQRCPGALSALLASALITARGGFEEPEIPGELKIEDFARHPEPWVCTERFYTQHFCLASDRACDALRMPWAGIWNCQITLNLFPGRQRIFQNEVKAPRTQILGPGFNATAYLA
jgi:hypothetical protein